MCAPPGFRSYRAEFRNRSRLKFSEKSAGEIAEKKGLRKKRCRHIWVEAAAAAVKDGLRVCTVGALSGSPSWYHVVPVVFFLPVLQNHLAEVQVTQSNISKTRTSNDNYYSLSILNALSNAGNGSRRLSPTAEPFHPRAMDSDDWSFVCHMLKSKQKDFGQARGCSRDIDYGDTISIEAFVQFCKWWKKAMATTSRMLVDWVSTRPIKIHGFVSRERAESMLREKEPGTFLFRFSASEPGLMTISFKTEVCRATTLCFARAHRSMKPREKPVARARGLRSYRARARSGYL